MCEHGCERDGERERDRDIEEAREENGVEGWNEKILTEE